MRVDDGLCDVFQCPLLASDCSWELISVASSLHASPRRFCLDFSFVPFG